MFAKIIFLSSVEQNTSGEENVFLQMWGKKTWTCETRRKKKVWAGVICFAYDQNNKRFQDNSFFPGDFSFHSCVTKYKIWIKMLFSCLKHDFDSLTCDRGKNKVLAGELFLLKGHHLFSSVSHRRGFLFKLLGITHTDFLLHIFTDRLFVNADDAKKWFNLPLWKPNKLTQ